MKSGRNFSVCRKFSTKPRPGKVRTLVRAIGLNRAEATCRSGECIIDSIFSSSLGYEATNFVVVSAASGSVGIAGIQTAQVVGARAIALTPSMRKRQAVLDLGASHVITRDTDVFGGILRETSERVYLAVRHLSFLLVAA